MPVAELFRPLRGISFAALVVVLLAPAAVSGEETELPGILGDAARSAPPNPSHAAAGSVTGPHRAAPRAAELAFTGDIIPHKPVSTFARGFARNVDAHYDFTPIFEHVAPELQAADLAICHLETTISNGPVTGYPRFGAPWELVEAIAEAGWDGCSLASNHAFDFGAEGVVRTIRAMQEANLAFTGTAVDRESRRDARYGVNGIQVSHLSYTYGLNGARLPEGETWWVNLIDVEIIGDDAREARSDGAEFVVVSLHWGVEYRRMPSASQERLAREIAALGTVDLLIGHHAHVLQPIDRIDDMWVAYGLGNFLSNQNPVCCTPSSGDGAVLHVEIGDSPDGLAVGTITYTPTWVDRRAMQIIPVADRLSEPDVDQRLQATLRESWERTVEALGALGADQLGVRPTGSLPPPG
ncbi:MAG: CapA family protein [bacterium]|nr:CapA family protein [bacterium]